VDIIQKMKCPECGRRILDIDTKATVEVVIEAKCPHCKKVVTVCWKPQEKK